MKTNSEKKIKENTGGKYFLIGVVMFFVGMLILQIQV